MNVARSFVAISPTAIPRRSHHSLNASPTTGLTFRVFGRGFAMNQAKHIAEVASSTLLTLFLV